MGLMVSGSFTERSQTTDQCDCTTRASGIRFSSPVAPFERECMLAVNSDRLDVRRHIDDGDVSAPTDGPDFHLYRHNSPASCSIADIDRLQNSVYTFYILVVSLGN